MHRLLKRQLKRLQRQFPGEDIPQDALLEFVSRAYGEADQERRMRDRSLQLMSTELLQANQQIRQESETYIGMILSKVAEGVCTFSQQGVIKSINPALERIFLLWAEDYIGQKIDVFNIGKPKSEPLNLLQMASQVMNGEALPLSETLACDANGRCFPIEISMSNMLIGGELTHIAIIRDISERKQHERLLVEAKEQAEEVSQAKSQFLSVMSHEIRTPLNAVLGITNLLIDDSPREDQQEDLQSLKFSAEHLLVLINDILDFSKIEAGKVVLKK